MAKDDRTDRYRPVFEPEDIFDRFVKNANASSETQVPRDDDVTNVTSSSEIKPPRWDKEVTVRAASPRQSDEHTKPDAPMPLAIARAFDDPTSSETETFDDEDDEEDATNARAQPLATDSGHNILLLTRKKTLPGHAALIEHGDWESVVSVKGTDTQKLEALRVVPNVQAAKKREQTYVGEGVEDGQIPTRQLDQLLSDMAVLLRYGHAPQVRERLDKLRHTYPEDLLLLRRIAEFHVEHDQRDAALDALFALAAGLFERRNVEGMRQALEQVLVLDPENQRAYRLLGLLEQR
jgi:hypothetical protein